MSEEIRKEYQEKYKQWKLKTRDELVGIRDDFQEDVDNADKIISHAKAKAFTEGIFAESKWFREQTEMVKIKRRSIQKLNELIGRKKREEINRSSFMNRSKDMGTIFMKEAEKHLPKEIYEKILDCACQKLAQGGNDVNENRVDTSNAEHYNRMHKNQ